MTMTRSLLAASALTLIAFSSAQAADTLPLKHVTLSTSGLAQFEHQGKVTGNEELSFPVRLDQVDDVLKSLVVLDDGGSFGGVTLPGREPLGQTFRDLPFKQADLGSLENLLTALQGSDVQATDDGVVITGRLVNVVPEQSITKDQQVIRRHRITIMSKDGMHTLLMEDLKNLQFTEPAVQAQLDRALAAIHDHRVQDQRTVTLDLRGTGERAVSVSYVTGAPLWKSAYRLVLPEKDTHKAYLQGWAILENTTGQDWKDVSVTLLSGNPVTYKQSLYESYYLDRPFLPLRVMDRLMPRTDTGSVVAVDKFQQQGSLQAQPPAAAPMPGRMGMMMAKTANMAAAGAASGGAPMESMADDGVASDEAASMPAMTPTTMAASPATAIAEQATAQMVFNFPQTVSLAAGGSMMLPVISRDIPADQLWLYQPDTNDRHPLSAVSLKNDSETGLPPGILTLFEKGKSGLRYTGDAELALLPKGETRYITFALDPATTIDRVVSSDRQYGAFIASKGVFRQKVVSSETTTYTVKAPADEDRILVIEQPRRGDWELKVPEGLASEPEKTETHYRLKLALKAGETKTLKVMLEHQDFEGLSLGNMNPADLSARMGMMGQGLDTKTRKVLEQAIALQNEVYSINTQIQTLDQERETISDDQDRLRDNIKSIPSNSDLAKRYMTQMNVQEDRVEKIDAEEKTLRQKQDEARKKLNDYIQGIEL
jgi:hypothetical protein